MFMLLLDVHIDDEDNNCVGEAAIEYIDDIGPMETICEDTDAIENIEAMEDIEDIEDVGAIEDTALIF